MITIEKLQEQTWQSLLLEAEGSHVKIVTSRDIRILPEKEYRILLDNLSPDNFSYHALIRLLGINNDVLGELLGTSHTTLHRIIKGQSKLNKNAYFRLNQLIDIIFTGIEVFEFVIGDFVEWMHTEIIEKENQTPLEIFINNSLSYKILIDILLRIDHGIYS